MLSASLRGLRAFFAPYDSSALQLSPKCVAGIINALSQAIEDAEELEARPVPKIDQLPGDLPENVVRLAMKLNQQGVRAGCAKKPGGDNAA